ncbi:hypothetical protein AFB00_14780 [Pseudonocardia sp. HH130630-07]|nr:hypothetical protein AFB00_14780 [Pseudonocardia sp. HH130630-07]
MSDLVVRPAVPGDIHALHRFVVALAEDEAFPGDVTASPSSLTDALFGAHPVAEAVIAAVRERPVGFALFYPTYSTVLGRQGIHLDDLYVDRIWRGRGVGRILLKYLTDIANARGCGRVEWWVLRTNVDAIRFYRRLQARGLDEIEVMRLDGDALRSF